MAMPEVARAASCRCTLSRCELADPALVSEGNAKLSRVTFTVWGGVSSFRHYGQSVILLYGACLYICYACVLCCCMIGQLIILKA